MKWLLPAFMLLWSSYAAIANNLQISNVSTNVNGTITTVSFDIAWENSWRGGVANNYDAAWVFIKYKDQNNEWHHLNLTGADNSTTAPLTIEAPSDKKGVFIYRSANGIGDISPTTVVLGVQQQPGLFDIKIFGIEMVYIPQGEFYVGGADAVGYMEGGTGVAAMPYLISSPNLPMMGNSIGQLYDYRGNGVLDQHFPSGYGAFYIMKYELSQAGYRDFLNTTLEFNSIYAERTALTPANYQTSGSPLLNASRRNFLEVTGNSNNPVGCDANANNIFNEADDGEWVACNWLLWSDLAAFLDWAALRPMTDLEYEKACRGSENVLINSHANYSTIHDNAVSIQNSGTANETATFTGPNNSYLNILSSINGPLRNGFAGTQTSNRKNSGASYYGVFELSGNVGEYTVSTGNTAGRSFSGKLGNGEIYNNNPGKGSADVPGWPGCLNNDISQPNIAGYIAYGNTAGISVRGGAFANFFGYIGYIQTAGMPTGTRGGFEYAFGGRGVRQQF